MSAISEYRYPGSRPFQDTPLERRLFFGRDHEKHALLHTILAEKLVVLFAKSGIGKTSLINAGLMQLLRERDLFPVIVRFNDPEVSPLQAIYEGLKTATKQDGGEFDENKPLLSYFNTFKFKTFDVWASKDILLRPVLILEQFEELFTLHAPEKRKAFITQLSDLIRGSETSPNLKIIISVREDYLGLLEEVAEEIPDILQNRFRLTALIREQAKQAIVEPARVEDGKISTKSFCYAPEAVEAMLDFLCKQRKRDGINTTNEVEPFQLQLLCQHIENMVSKKPGTNGEEVFVQREDLGGEVKMQKVLQNFYENQINRLGSIWNKRRVRKLCEKGLISVSGRRLSLEEEEIERRFKISKELLAKLVNSRLLRSEPRVGSIYYELSHDALVEPIRESSKTHYRKGNIIWAFLVCIELIIIIFFLIPEGPIYGSLGYVYYKIGKYNKASDYYYKALQCNPDNILYYNNLGYALNKQGKYEEAIKNFEKAITIDPQFISAKMKLAEIYLVNEYFDKSFFFANEVLEASEVLQTKSISPEDILSMRFIVISSLLFQERQSEAFGELEKFIEYYKSLSKDYERSWNYTGSKNLISNTEKLTESERHFLLTLIDVLELPKPEADKYLKNLKPLLQNI